MNPDGRRAYNLYVTFSDIASRLLGERGRTAALSVALTLAVSFVAWAIFTDSWRTGLGYALAVSLIYGLPMTFLSVLVMPRCRERIDALPSPWDWVAFLVVLTVLSGITITVSSGFMVLARLVSPLNPWPGLRLVNRLAFAMCLLFAGGFRFIAVSRRLLEARNRMLEEKVTESAREQQIQQQEGERAREIQQALFPKELPRMPGCDLAAGCLPARVVGGDYFDAIPLDDGRLVIAVADVVGKGMAAALLMSNLQAIVRSFASLGLSPAEMCRKANQVIAGNIAAGKFITFFYALVEPGGAGLDYCNAGHNPPVLLRRSGKVERLADGGPLLGIFPQAEYLTGQTGLEPGDTLVLFTDGITEAAADGCDEFGEERLVDIARDSHTGSAETVRKRIMEAVLAFSHDSLQDDATLLVMMRPIGAPAPDPR